MSAPNGAVVLDVVHDTIYRYSAPVDTAHHLACLMPQSVFRQKLRQHQLMIDPEPSARANMVDVFGNTRTHFSLFTPHEALCVRATSRVDISPRGEPLDPQQGLRWEAVRGALRYRARAAFWPAADFIFASNYVPLLPELRAYAQQSFPARRPFVAGAIDLMRRIHADFTYEAESTDVATPLAEVFAQRRGVCQDYAHVMIGALRVLGLPAAYISGYLLTRRAHEPQLVGADASHAWVSVWCPVLGWVDLDPTNNLVVETTHVTLAVGRDFGDVTPLRGVIRGGGQHALEVAVTVRPAAVP